MQRDIDLIREQLTANIPGAHIAQLEVSHPGADDDGLWFINIQDHPGQVQIESPDGMCPFLIEADFSNERLHGYSATLKGFSDAVKPGMSRREVEVSLQLQHRAFRQMCCVRVPRSAYADLVKIGQEEAPWFCNHHNIYVAFEFETTQPHGPVSEARDSDKLEAVSLFPWLEECL